ncbi:polysaccharide biosynthesis tyrosine autokinase [Corynebacterium guangdongense]|uniref:non-specific protein-tyrosine kinase n=1 Tax=Corynebacterium guangdongense TaxID=1783348 RepID=A0ABU1ZYA7_9CORY|nr:polysaccharide biosynthesis tyrosine autokinase [Corynebacterium guangdongense]MDR7329910.1 capsular exopolysaccharide synthesis family protein [Corynebacterium guangdongense]WJZ18468.1 Tyrosine-protein kinase YwqD [Corynebacterium guangdongense]
MELRDYLLLLRKNWILIMLLTMVGLAVGATASALAAPVYQSRTQLYVSVRAGTESASDLVQGASYSSQIVNSYVDVITSGLVLDPVVEELDLPITSTELARRVDASSPSDSALIDIFARGYSPEEAALLANTVGESFKEVVRTQLEPEDGTGPSPVALTTTQVGLEPEGPVSPDVMLNLLLGALVGFAAGFGLAVLRSMLDNRVHSAEDIELLTEEPVLGGIVHDPRAKKNPLVAQSDPQSPRAEAYRSLRTNLQFVTVGVDKPVMVVTSPKPAEGKTTTALNLALTLSQTGSRVVVVEGDLRKPRISEYLGIEGGAGLTDVLIGRAEPLDVLQRWGRTQFYVLPGGRIPPNPSELLGSQQMSDLLEELSSQFDYVIVDAPPVLAVTDAAVLGKESAGVLLIVAAGSTTRQDVTGSLQALETAGVNVLGVVATMLPAKGPNSYSYGRYSYRAQTPDQHGEFAEISAGSTRASRAGTGVSDVD